MSELNYITVDQYFRYLSQEKLMASKCIHCGNIDLPARRLCSKCIKEADWIELSGKGTLETFTAVYVGAEVMTKKGYNRKKPYIFAIAKMNEGPSISGQLIGVDETNPESIKLGIPLKVIYIKTEIGKDDKQNIVYRWDVGFKPL